MMLTYGFSAKKSSGLGETKDDIQEQSMTALGPKKLEYLSTLEVIAATVPANKE